MTRKEAVDRLAAMMVTSMPTEERASRLYEWWTIDEADPEWRSLPTSLRDEMRKHDEPEAGVADSRYTPLLVASLRFEMHGVRNEWIEMQLSSKEPITGPVEHLEACPCCSYRTLRTRGDYEICPACFWEDDGGEDEHRYSGPNRQTLAEARENFRRFGASNERSIDSVDKDPAARYLKS